MKRIAFVLITLHAAFVFPICAAHDMQPSGRAEAGESVTLEKMDFCGKVPASFHGVCVKGKEGWMVRIRALNGNELNKPVMAAMGGPHPDFVPEEGKECAGVAAVSIPDGMEMEPDRWTVSGESVRIVRENTPDNAMRVNDAVLNYYHRRSMDMAGFLMDLLNQAASREQVGKEEAYYGKKIAGWILIEASVPFKIRESHIKRNKNLAEESRVLMDKLEKASRRMERSGLKKGKPGSGVNK